MSTGNLFRGLRKQHFACIAIDPPWHHATWSERGRGRSPKYMTMENEQIADVALMNYAAEDCFVFLWITGPFLAIGAHVPLMAAWGFQLSSVAFVWLKPTEAAYHYGGKVRTTASWQMGLGKTTRQNAEFVILGRRGSPKRLSAAVRQEIIEPAREHSRKPEKFYERVEMYCAGPRLDVFGRQRRPGWTVIGNEADKFMEG